MLGENIKKIRKNKKLSLRALSEKSGISKTTINEIENGIVTNPTLVTIDKIAKALDTTYEDLLGTIGRLLVLIDSARFGSSIEDFSQSTGISADYLTKLYNGDITEPPSPEILKKIADSPENRHADNFLQVDYAEFLEAARYIDRKTKQLMHKELLDGFNETVDIDKIRNTLIFLENNPLLVKYFESSNFTPDEIEKIIDYMNFILSQRNKK